MKAIALAALAAALALAAPAVASDAPVSVMIVGTFHMSNPGHDLHNMHADDVLMPKPQSELERIARALLRFKPTVVAAEWDADTTRERYAKYLAGTLDPSHNEVVQLGFRLAKAANLAAVYGIDVDGDFPYDAVDAYAKAHGQSALLESANADIQTEVAKEEKLLATRGISATLRWMNDSALVAQGNGFYRTTLHIGSGKDQPGAELLTAWYHRNFLICANLIQVTKPGDHVVVFYGAGHSFLLRQCVQETPGFKLVEPNNYLPR